jgi:hypothetical protein
MRKIFLLRRKPTNNKVKMRQKAQKPGVNLSKF